MRPFYYSDSEVIFMENIKYNIYANTPGDYIVFLTEKFIVERVRILGLKLLFRIVISRMHRHILPGYYNNFLVLNFSDSTTNTFTTQL